MILNSINHMELSEEQRLVFNKYVNGDNIFITGPGGTGKSALIREIYKHANSYGKKIQVCALTGCAALLLQCKAKTIHSWAGIGQGTGPNHMIIERVTKNKYKQKIWTGVDILIVDEVSMMSKKLFDILNELGKRVRKNSDRPFGGIQVIFSGDFYQLPPVGDKDEPESSQFCFESEDWNAVFSKENQIPLVKIFRQADPVYANILNQLREGKLKRSSYEILQSHIGKPIAGDSDIQPTKLYPRRHSVESINNNEMNKIETDEKKYAMKRLVDLIPTRKTYSKDEVDYEYKYLESSIQCEHYVQLKIGAQVMCVVNMETSSGYALCNGSQGIVIRFNEQGLPVVKFRGIPIPILVEYHNWVSETIPSIGIAQVPLILAWALTIHKAQGATLDLAEIDVGNNVFECGQTYVALSRVKSLEGLYLTAFNYQKVYTNKKVKEYYKENIYFEKKAGASE
jgi:ATP-dependent DNA helicase PIF1